MPGGEIGQGICVFAAVAASDTKAIADWMSHKIINLRIFNDENGKMNHSSLDIGGEILFVTNFTLYGDCSKGFRPGWSRSAGQEISEPLCEYLLDKLRSDFPNKVISGRFGADMQVSIINDGPVTLIIDK